jgi:hypothetical protein
MPNGMEWNHGIMEWNGMESSWNGIEWNGIMELYNVPYVFH